jgi:hypothetical protein
MEGGNTFSWTLYPHEMAFLDHTNCAHFSGGQTVTVGLIGRDVFSLMYCLSLSRFMKRLPVDEVVTVFLLDGGAYQMGFLGAWGYNIHEFLTASSQGSAALYT